MHTITLENLEEYLENPDCDKGWIPLLRSTLSSLLLVGWDGNLLQVKEKFGGLRIYIGSGTDIMFDMLDTAEQESFTICEVCGEPGKLRMDRSWYKTLCDEHNN